MTKDNTPRQKQAQNTPSLSADATKKQQQQFQAALAPLSPQTRKGGKNHVGGTAIPGAKSTLPKPASTSSNPQQQEAESSNRVMRRRMQRLHTGPYSEKKVETPVEKRRKRIERKKQRLEEQRAQLRRSLPAGKVTLGRKNLYFVLAVLAIIILLVVIFLIIRR